MLGGLCPPIGKERNLSQLFAPAEFGILVRWEITCKRVVICAAAMESTADGRPPNPMASIRLISFSSGDSRRYATSSSSFWRAAIAGFSVAGGQTCA
jgi:hypothetical protein